MYAKALFYWLFIDKDPLARFRVKEVINLRDPKRIYAFCHELAELWATKVPDWRFGQLVLNVLGEMQVGGRDPFFPEEGEMMDFFMQYFGDERR